MNKTEKLYYNDPYISEFEATVLSCDACEGGYVAVLDKTAFFPNEAGQRCDSGLIGDTRVISVDVKGGVIYHKLASPISAGERAVCKIDFDKRLERMQCHTAEHILSGIIHREWGYDNVGFHLGEDEVTLDTSSPLSPSDLDTLEYLANDAVMKNIPVVAKVFEDGSHNAYPFRSKIELSGDVRLVFIDGVDICACCAPHVSTTGEIGLIKIIRADSHKGGTRIYMLAGKRAYEYITKVYKTATCASRILSYPVLDIDNGCQRLADENQALKSELSALKRRNALAVLDTVEATSDKLVHIVDSDDMNLVRECANLLFERTGKTAVCLSARQSGFAFVMICEGDAASECKKATAALNGRGGGRGSMAQGSFCADIEAIRKYFLS